MYFVTSPSHTYTNTHTTVTHTLHSHLHTHTLSIHTTTHIHSQDTEREVSSFLSRKLSGRLAGIDMVEKEDLDLVSGLRGHSV